MKREVLVKDTFEYNNIEYIIEIIKKDRDITFGGIVRPERRVGRIEINQGIPKDYPDNTDYRWWHTVELEERKGLIFKRWVPKNGDKSLKEQAEVLFGKMIDDWNEDEPKNISELF